MTHRTFFLTLNLFLSLLLINGCGGTLDAVLSGAAAQDDAPDELTWIDLENLPRNNTTSNYRLSGDGKLVVGTGYTWQREGTGLPDVRDQKPFLRVWDTETGKHLQSVEVTKTDTRVPAGQEFFSADCESGDISPDGTLALWVFYITSQPTSPEGQTLGGRDIFTYETIHYVVLIDPRTGKEIRQLATYSWKSTPPGGVVIHTMSAFFSPDGKKIVLSISVPDKDATRKIQILDTQTGRVLQTIEGKPGSEFHAVSLARNGKLLTFDGDKTQVFDINTGKELHQWENNSFLGYHIANLSSDGTKVVTREIVPGERNSYGFQTGTSIIKIWDVQTKKELQKFELLSDIFLGDSISIEVAFLPDAKHIVLYGGKRGDARIMNTESGEIVLTLPPPLPH